MNGVEVRPAAQKLKAKMNQKSGDYSKRVRSRKRKPMESNGMRASYQTMIVQLGELGLTDASIQSVIEKAVALIESTLEVDYCAVLEQLPNNDSFLMRAGSGWTHAKTGTVVVENAIDFQEGYTIGHSEPVVVNNFEIETRFQKSPLLQKHEVESSLSVAIHNWNVPFGILGVFTKGIRKFTEDEVHFLQAAANILSDVIERRELEESLRMSEQKYRTLFEESRDAIFISTPEGDLIDINPAGIDLFEFESKDEMLQINVEYDLYMEPAERKKYRKLLSEIGHVKNFEFAMQTRNGRILFVEESSTAVHDHRGNIIAYRGIMRDVTKTREMQHRLQQIESIVRDPARTSEVKVDQVVQLLKHRVG